MKVPLKTPVDFNIESMLAAWDDKLSGERAMLALWWPRFGLEFYAVPDWRHLGTTALRSRYARHPCIDERAVNHVKVARGWNITLCFMMFDGEKFKLFTNPSHDVFKDDKQLVVHPGLQSSLRSGVLGTSCIAPAESSTSSWSGFWGSLKIPDRQLL